MNCRCLKAWHWTDENFAPWVLFMYETLTHGMTRSRTQQLWNVSNSQFFTIYQHSILKLILTNLLTMLTSTVWASFPPLLIAIIMLDVFHISLFSIFGQELFLKKLGLPMHVEIDIYEILQEDLNLGTWFLNCFKHLHLERNKILPLAHLKFFELILV